MPFTEQDLQNLQRKVARYHEVLQNTKQYREIWKKSLKKNIVAHLRSLMESGGLKAKILEVSDIENLEAVALTLGTSESGLGEDVTLARSAAPMSS